MEIFVLKENNYICEGKLFSNQAESSCETLFVFVKPFFIGFSFFFKIGFVFQNKDFVQNPITAVSISFVSNQAVHIFCY